MTIEFMTVKWKLDASANNKGNSRRRYIKNVLLALCGRNQFIVKMTSQTFFAITNLY